VKELVWQDRWFSGQAPVRYMLNAGVSEYLRKQTRNLVNRKIWRISEWKARPDNANRRTTKTSFRDNAQRTARLRSSLHV